jgi:hypothetical protein
LNYFTLKYQIIYRYAETNNRYGYTEKTPASPNPEIAETGSRASYASSEAFFANSSSCRRNNHSFSNKFNRNSIPPDFLRSNIRQCGA